MSNRVFISYSHDDYLDKNDNVIVGSAVYNIRKALDANGIEYWIDDRIRPGDPFARNIGEAIDECDLFLFVSSARSNASEWAHGEIHTARQKSKRIVPFKIDHAPYHNSYCVYLSPLDYIDYTVNKDLALQKLVNIALEERISIELSELVSYEKKGKDLMIGCSKLSDKVLLLFSALDLVEALNGYLEVVDVFAKLGNQSDVVLHDVIGRVEEITDLMNAEIRRQKLVDLTTLIQSRVDQEQRVNRFLLQLGLMVAYYWLDESKMVRKIQMEVKKCTFDLSWWEKNGDTVKEVGGTVLGIAAAILTRTNPGGGMKYGWMGGKQASDEHKKGLRNSRLYFEALRDVISSLKFEG